MAKGQGKMGTGKAMKVSSPRQARRNPPSSAGLASGGGKMGGNGQTKAPYKTLQGQGGRPGTPYNYDGPGAHANATGANDGLDRMNTGRRTS